MELRHLRYFLAVAEAQNFTRAAEKAGIGQSPLSQQIRALERELDATLFRRLPYGVALTEAGRAFLPEAQATLDQAASAVRAAQRGAAGEIGRLRLGYTSSAAFNPIVSASLRAFRRRYPQVEMTLEEANTARLSARLADGALDAALIRPGGARPKELRLHPVVDEPIVIVLPDDHPLAEADALPLSALSGEPLVLFPREAGPSFFDAVIAGCRAAGFEPTLGPSTPEIVTVGALIAAGFGVSLAPAPVSQAQVSGVRYVPVLGEAPVARIALATRLEPAPVTLRHFIRILAAERRAGAEALAASPRRV